MQIDYRRRNFERAIRAAWIVAVALIAAGPALSAPHEGDLFTFRQPDGTAVEVRVFGDEFYQRVESLDGYTLIRDPQTSWICYAERSDDGRRFTSTGVVYRATAAPDLADPAERRAVLRLTRGLRLNTAEIRRRARLRRTQLLGDEPATEESRATLMAAPAAAAVENVVGLTIPIQFSDEPATISQAEIDRFCNQIGYTGYDNNGSVRDYFYDVSDGNLEYINHVTAYYTAKNPKTYYDDCSGGRTRELIGEALQWLEAQGFDFTILSVDSQNRVIALNFYYAGSPECGWSNGLWPHMGGYGSFTSSSGVKSNRYQISNIGSQLRLGTFCHENGHMVGRWPDLYDYGGESSGVGGYCLMASSGGRNPKPPNPYFRALKGWETIIEINSDSPGSVRTHQANSFTTYRYSHPTNLEEFFLVESRLRIGRHEGIPDEGLIIWHIDESGSNNNEQMTPQQHYRVSVEQADGKFELEKGINGGGSGDLFHAAYRDVFDDETLPDARWWDGVESGMGVDSISSVSSAMTFRVNNKPISLSISPGAVNQIRGLTEGPFNPQAAGYTLTNYSGSTIEWTASSTATWLDVPTGGSIAPDTSAVCNAVLSSEAWSLAAGVYTDTITFTDVTNSLVRYRDVELIIEPRQLTAWWPLDETTGTETIDATGHNNNGRIQGGASFANDSISGMFNRALHFDGADDTLLIEGFSLPRPFFTIAFWFKPDVTMSSSSSRDDFLYWDDGSHPHISFNRKGSGEIGLSVEYESVEYDDILTSTRSWSASRWHHIAFTFDGSDYSVYVGGDLEGVFHHPGLHIDTSDPYIASKTGDSGFFAGSIDDFRFYSYALPADAVRSLYRGGRAENPVPVDRSASVRPYTGLRWTGGAGVYGHDVYLGTDPGSVQNAAAGSPEYLGRVVSDFFTGSVLYPDTTYYWRVDEVIDRDRIKGQIWSFTTGGNDPYEDIYEAEDAYLSGPEVASSYDGYTGSGYADYINASADYAEYSVFAHYAGPHEISFRYALSSGSRPLEIRVNGQIVTTSMGFPSTGSWANWSYTGSLTVNLDAGYNTIRATATGSKGANVDHLKVLDKFDYTPQVTGLQLCLKLDESAGGTAFDSSGNEHHGIINGRVLWSPTGGAFGGAVQLPSTGDYIEVPDYKAISGSRARTVAAWIRTDKAASADIVSWGRSSPGQRWSLMTFTSGEFGVYIGDGMLMSSAPVTDGNWHHVAAVLDNENGGQISEVRLYVDAKLQTPSAQTPGQINTASADNVKIGAFADGSGNFFHGMVDEVAVFDIALTDAEIARLYRFASQSFLQPCGRMIEDADYVLAADINRDCLVNVVDFALLAEAWVGSDGRDPSGRMPGGPVSDWPDLSQLAADWLVKATSFERPKHAMATSPYHGQTEVWITSDLSWIPGEGAVSHDVYFGPSDPPAFQGSQTAAAFDPGTMAYNTTYYWRVDEVNHYGRTVGNTWNFTTKDSGGR